MDERYRTALSGLSPGIAWRDAGAFKPIYTAPSVDAAESTCAHWRVQ